MFESYSFKRDLRKRLSRDYFWSRRRSRGAGHTEGTLVRRDCVDKFVLDFIYFY